LEWFIPDGIGREVPPVANPQYYLHVVPTIEIHVAVAVVGYLRGMANLPTVSTSSYQLEDYRFGSAGWAESRAPYCEFAEGEEHLNPAMLKLEEVQLQMMEWLPMNLQITDSRQSVAGGGSFHRNRIHELA